jgi:arylsulfatase A-like enzyme
MRRTIGSLIALALALTACSSSSPSEPKKPNFLILLVDDLGWTDLGVQGSDLYETPSIDQLASDGLRFTQAYAACTVCSPTRAAMMTGMYPARTHVTDWIRGYQRPYAQLEVPDWTMRLDHEHTSIAEALKSEGYRTAHIGKWHLMPTGEPEQEDYSPTRHGFEINIGGNEWGQPGSYFHPYSRGNRSFGPMPPGGEEGDYLTDRLTDEAIKILDHWQTGPWLMYFAYYNVHTPLMAREDDVAHYEERIEPGMRHSNPTYAGMVTSVDRSVGRLRRRLEELGIADNTIIIFTGDNGGLDRDGSGQPTENQPLRSGKGSAYEGGVRVPGIIHAPGITEAGTTTDEPIITVDYYPTILALAGVRGDPLHNSSVDGVNLEPVLRNPSANLGRKDLFWHYPHYHSQGTGPYSAVRSGDWRLVEFHEDNHIELYNLADDIGETRELADEEPERALELKERLQTWRESVGAQIPKPNPNRDPERAGERGQEPTNRN